MIIHTSIHTYRWRSLPRVHQRKASKPQGSSKRVLPCQVTMEQLIRASLSHTTHYWYEVGMLNVSAGSRTPATSRQVGIVRWAKIFCVLLLSERKRSIQFSQLNHTTTDGSFVPRFRKIFDPPRWVGKRPYAKFRSSEQTYRFR